ncbi:MAG: phosphoribosylamine--glycine ligase [Acidobacteria bacterium]|nr:phosphoribosylamine--glycine ligase [Acidobacteriota bacterium]
MKILVIGGGGREHAIAWRLLANGHTVFACPGNPGITAHGGTSIPGSDHLAAAREADVDLTVVGPEAPLVAGVVDQFRAEGLRIVGPTAANAQLEASKMYSKQFMVDTGIPTARFARVESVEDGLRALDQFPELPVVIKADGLAAGKGVIIAHTAEEARDAVRSLGPKLVIEEFLTGEEVSFIAICDGKGALALEPTQDHKTIFDGDTGPNTGGMGSYCDGRILTPEQSAAVLRTVIEPAVARLHFTGFLYAGLMMTAAGPKVLEFNVRLGDPETQTLMHRMDCDFGEILLAASEPGGLAGKSFSWKADPSVCVVMSAAGYPATPRSGDVITGIEDASEQQAVVFQAGTKQQGDDLVTAGGRVLGVTAAGTTLRDAIVNTYDAVSRISFAGAHYRRDIGAKGLKRWKE